MPNAIPNDTRTLTRHDYLSEEIYELERQRTLPRCRGSL